MKKRQAQPNSLELNRLSYKLIPVSIRELLFISTAPCDIYGLNDDKLFFRCLRKGVFTDQNLLRELIAKGKTNLFAQREERELIVESVQKNLLHITRSLSLGSPLEKGKSQMNLLTINMGYLYNNPTSDTILKLQHQCAKNLAYFLMGHINLLDSLLREFLKQKHHFIFSQPLVASLFLLGFMKYSKLHNDDDIASLFITSYFKDIGMCSLPMEKYNEDKLTKKEKEILNSHPKRSLQILKDRIPLGPNHLSIIENHHLFSLLNNKLEFNLKEKQRETPLITATETMLVTVMDIISAMITGRPFRGPAKIFEALDLIKVLVAEAYPQEFRLIVNYFKNF